MPRKKQKDAEIDMGPIKEEFATQSAALLEEFEDRIVDILERSDKDKIGIGLHLTIDNSKQEIKVSTRIAFGENYGDEKVSQLDIAQGKFAEVLDSAKGKKGKKPAEEDDTES